MSIAAAAITAGASLLGGLFDNGQRKKELKMQDPVYRRKRLEAAGYNPLMLDSYNPQVGYAPSFGQSLAEAGHALSGLVPDRESELRETQIELQNRILEKELQNATFSPVQSSVYQGSDATPFNNNVQNHQNGVVDGTRIGVAGTVEHNSTVSDAEDVERRYGDIIGSVYGIVPLAHDTVDYVFDSGAKVFDAYKNANSYVYENYTAPAFSAAGDFFTRSNNSNNLTANGRRDRDGGYWLDPIHVQNN